MVGPLLELRGGGAGAGGAGGRGGGGGGGKRVRRTLSEGVAAKLQERRTTFLHLDNGVGGGKQSLPGRRGGGGVPLLTRAVYGAPSLSTTSLTFLNAVYVTDFYVGLGADLGFISFFTALARSFDVITDPVMGWASDQTRTRYGRRRPFMAAGCAVYALMLFFLYTPGLVGGSKDDCTLDGRQAAYWFGTFYTLFYLADTFTNVPYEAMGPELSDSYEERSRVFFVQKLFNFLGMLLAAAAPATLAVLLRMSGVQQTSVACAAVLPPGEPYAPVPPPCQNATRCAAASGSFCFLEPGTGHVFEASQESMEHSCPREFANAASSLAVCPILGTPAWGPGACPVPLEPEDLWWGRVGTGEMAEGRGGCAKFWRYDMLHMCAQRSAFSAVAASFGVYHVLALALCIWLVRERVLDDRGPGYARAPLLGSILRAFRNSAFQPLLVGWALDGLALTSLVTMFPFYIRYVISSDGLRAREIGQNMDPNVCMGLSMVGMLFAAMAASPLWLRLSREHGKYKCWVLYNLCNVATNLLLFVPGEGQSYVMVAMAVINGLPVGGSFLVNSILADVIDYDEFLHGGRNEGSFSVFSTLIPKFIAIPAAAIPLALINSIGFKPPVEGVAQPQEANVRTFIRLMFVLLPFLSYLSGLLVKIRFPIKSRASSDQISRGIALHALGHAATDPVTGVLVPCPSLEPPEEAALWAFESFSQHELELFRALGPGALTRHSLRWAQGSAAFAAAMLGVVGGTFSLLSHRRLSVLPVLAVILLGLGATLAALHTARWLQARAVQRRKPKPEVVAFVLKMRGLPPAAPRKSLAPEERRVSTNNPVFESAGRGSELAVSPNPIFDQGLDTMMAKLSESGSISV